MQNLQNLQSSNWIFVSAAYAAAWIVVGGYAWHVHRTLKRARQALAQSGGRAAGGESWK